MKTKKLTRAEKEALGMSKPAQSKFEMKRAKERAAQIETAKKMAAE